MAPLLRPLRRRLALATAALLLSTGALADPSRISIIVPYAPGGLSDTLARLTASALAKSLGVPVIVDNRPGANGVLGLQAIAHAAPDGATIGLVPASVMTVNPFLYKDMKVDTVTGVAPLTLAVTLPNVLVVHPSVPATSMAELLAWLKKSQSTVSFGSMGAGSSAHLNGEMLEHDTGLVLTHIPYKGSAPAMQDLVAGNIQMAFENLPVALPYIQAGKLRAIGVTSTSPSPQAPDIPPISRSLPGFEDNIWFGFIAPNGVPPAFAGKLHDHLVRAIRSAEVAGPMQERGATVMTGSPDAMRQVIVDERRKWGALIKDRRISLE